MPRHSANSQCHVSSATSQCQISSATSSMPGHSATSAVPLKAAQLQVDEAATAEKLRLQAEADADAQARRKESQTLLQRHEANRIEKLKYWHFEPNGDEPTPEEHHKELMAKLVSRLVYTCNHLHSELANLQRAVRNHKTQHEDATRALDARELGQEQAVPGPDAGASSSASSSRQLGERADHVVAMLGDISTFAAPTTTISSQLHTLKTEVQQLQSTNADGNPKMYKMPTFNLERFDDYTQQDPVLWWEAFTTQLRILPVAKHAYIGALFLNSKGGCQTWLSHLATSHGVDVSDLKDKITWEELTRLWKKRFIVNDAPTLAINRLFTMSQGNTATRDWLTEWQKIAAVPNLDLTFTHLRREFYNRSCAALSQALGDREQYSTFAEIIDKAREIIKTNRSGAHEKSTWQPTYVETVRTGPRQQHLAAVQQDSGDNPAATPPSGDGDQVAVVQPRSNNKSRNNGKAKPASQAGNGQLPWVKFGLTEAEYKVRGRYGSCYWCNNTKQKTSLCQDQGKEDVRPRTNHSTLEELDPLTFTDFQWMPVPPTGQLSKPHCDVLRAQLWDYLHTAVPAPLMDAGAEVVDLHAYIAKIDREFKTQRRFIHGLILRSRITELLDAYSDVFEGPHGVVPDRSIRHEIILEDGAEPPRSCIYRMSEEELSVLRTQLDDLPEKGWIRPSLSSYGAPVLFVRKKNKDLRLCIDYRKLNAQTIRNADPLPRIDDLLGRLGGAQFFSKLDLKSGYHQLAIRKEDRYKTAFKTQYGHFEWLVMPFGLTNAPATFQAAMTTEFRHMLDRFVLIYLDDILVYSRSLDEHVEHLRTVLERLRQAKYKANRDKSEFAQQELEYLGHYVTPQGIRPLADKIEALRVWPEPTNTTDVRSFMGLVGYYQRFITGYSRIAAPMTRLQSPKVPFVFDDDARRSFQALKTAMLMTPVLSIYDPTLPTRVTTDASGYGIGAVLEQHDGDDWHPVEYFSHKLPPINSLDDARKKELLAFVMALKRWRHFLLGRRRFTWVTDNNPLTYYKTQDTVSSTIGQWMYFIDQFDFTPKHVPGLSNRAADAVSRRPGLCAMTHHAFAFEEELQRHFIRAYQSDPDFGTLYAQLSSDHPPASHYRIADG
uniref:Reverse transcriptase domain-containing protein n=1 Tax=Chara braunii TaxID=69332 RepID=A0A388MEK4_CHABU